MNDNEETVANLRHAMGKCKEMLKFKELVVLPAGYDIRMSADKDSYRTHKFATLHEVLAFVRGHQEALE